MHCISHLIIFYQLITQKTYGFEIAPFTSKYLQYLQTSWSIGSKWGILLQHVCFFWGIPIHWWCKRSKRGRLVISICMSLRVPTFPHKLRTNQWQHGSHLNFIFTFWFDTISKLLTQALEFCMEIYHRHMAKLECYTANPQFVSIRGHEEWWIRLNDRCGGLYKTAFDQGPQKLNNISRNNGSRCFQNEHITCISKIRSHKIV